MAEPSAPTPEIIAAAERKAEQAERDAREKRVHYEDDPLFAYLWRRGFGTASYGSTGLVRFLDRKVAKLIRYDEAQRNYAMLIELPVRLREHLERIRSNARPGADRAASTTGEVNSTSPPLPR